MGDAAADNFEVVTADGARWRYSSTQETVTDQATGAIARIYRCEGRL
jgi:hypothetical protein